MKEYNLPCPVCNSDSIIIKQLDSSFLQKSLEKYYNEEIDTDLSLITYKIAQCKNCFLEFSSPMQGGSSEFYTWITNHKGYYPDHRWEWQEVVNQIQKQDFNAASLLEVGCGSGKFLELSQKNGIKTIGLDTTLTSV
ncbi:MAG: hypothetical protein ACKPCI_29410 [Dolichospermum sp.]